MQKHITFFIALFISFSSLAQVNLDSLWNVWNDKTQVDTIHLKAMHKIAVDGYLYSKPDSAFYFAQLQYDLAESVNNKKQMSTALNTQGASFYYRGDYVKSIYYFTESLKIQEVIGNNKGIAQSLNNIGAINEVQGDLAKAIDNYTKSLIIKEEIGDKEGIAHALNNIGNIYFGQGNYAKAIDYYTRSLKIRKEIGAKNGIAYSLYNIGGVYKIQEDYAKAIDYITKSLKIFEELGNKNGIANSLNYIGITYKEQRNYPKAIDYYTKSLKIREEIGDRNGIATSLNNIGSIYYKQGYLSKALEKSTKALYIAQKIGAVEIIKDASKNLWEINKYLGKHRMALEMHELYIQMRDSILSIENKEAMLHQEFKYKYEKAQALADAKHKAELKDKQNQQIILFGGLALVILFSLFMINRFRVTHRQKKVIEIKQKEITDNINYAKRIQKTLLPEEKLMNDFFSDFFVVYEPKDIVGGDFYWYRCFGDMAVIACVDCTGHGVAGGFMSMLGSLLLDKIIQNSKDNPSNILESLSSEVIRVLKQDAGGEIQDGMDMSLCIIDKKNMKLHFSGARNGILIADKENISHYKADLLPVGGAFSRKSREINRKFTTQSISITKDSWIIMYSDGYFDQLGGSKIMSMDSQKYIQLIQSAVNTNTDKKDFLMSEFKLWRGDFPQIDDLLVIGLKV